MGSEYEYEYPAEEKQHHKNIFHVLAVDDSNIDRKLLERLLTLSQYQVTCVDSGDKALEYLHLQYQTPPPQSSSNSTQQVSKVNLIMTDYSMPGISGYDLLKIIKEDSSWKDVPVIVMSSENVPSRINMCLEGGAEEFLLKPVKLSDLTKLQSHILKSHACRRETTIDSEEDKATNIDIGVNRDDEKEKTNDETNNINIDDESENDVKCRKATLTTILISRPCVQELPVA